MPSNSSPKGPLLASLAFVVVSAGAFGVLAWRNIHPSEAPLAPVKLADTTYAASISAPSPLNNDGWNPPPAQTRGRDWIYDAFTPPEIFYNARSKQFTVKPPAGTSEGEPEEAFGLELVTVRPEPFRLQLIGYVGDEGNWRGMFENVLSSEVFLAAAGRRVPNLALTIKSLEVRPQPVTLAEGMTTQQRVATAVVHDEKTGHDVTITHRARHFTGTVFASVAETGQSAIREVREGETVKLKDAVYRIDKVQITPPSIEVTKESPNLTQPERRTLTPREADTPETADATPDG